jgi:hypothetical protein
MMDLQRVSVSLERICYQQGLSINSNRNPSILCIEYDEKKDLILAVVQPITFLHKLLQASTPTFTSK